MTRPKTIPDDILLQHARDVFTELGNKASTKEIARRAGISEATVFQRFTTKGALFLAAMVPPPIDVNTIVDMTGLEADPHNALVTVSRRMIAAFQLRIPIVRRLLEHKDVTHQDVSDHLGKPGQQPIVRLTEALARELERLQASGTVKEHNSLAAARLLVSALHNLVAFDFSHGLSDDDANNACNTFVDALWVGLDPSETKSPRQESSHE